MTPKLEKEETRDDAVGKEEGSGVVVLVVGREMAEEPFVESEMSEVEAGDSELFLVGKKKFVEGEAGFVLAAVEVVGSQGVEIW